MGQSVCPTDIRCQHRLNPSAIASLATPHRQIIDKEIIQLCLFIIMYPPLYLQAVRYFHDSLFKIGVFLWAYPIDITIPAQPQGIFNADKPQAGRVLMMIPKPYPHYFAYAIPFRRNRIIPGTIHLNDKLDKVILNDHPGHVGRMPAMTVIYYKTIKIPQ